MRGRMKGWAGGSRHCPPMASVITAQYEEGCMGPGATPRAAHSEVRTGLVGGLAFRIAASYVPYSRSVQQQFDWIKFRS